MTPADHLSTAIDELRRALCAGNLSDLGPLAERIGDGLLALEQSMPSRDDLAPLRARAQEVETLLAAAGRGLVAGRRRLAEVEDLRRGLGTYDAGGRKRRIPAEITTPHRRA